MRLAILHHHLNRGGVSQVIANHLRSLATLPAAERPERVVLLYDGQSDGWPDDPLDGSGAFPVEHAVVPALAYDRPGEPTDPQAFAAAVSAALADHGCSPADTLLHTHNHSLGKNASLPGALRLFADAGWRMLLQVHDFAEDNRPENYGHLRDAIGESDPNRLGAVLYPQGPGIHYSTLTERDADILRAAGMPAERLHALPNPVAEFGEMPSQEAARSRVFPLLGLATEARLIVYPVRGIRRKNLGEMLLLSALAPEGTYFAVTLRPKNPVEAASFDRWRRLAEELDLPCRFNTGGPTAEGGYGCDFKDTLAAADAILTTSVAEGFGMVFLEAWLAGKPLIGRDLPEITREFRAAGMKLDSLWAELRASTHLDDDFGRLTPAEQVDALRQARRPSTPIDLGIEAAAASVASNAAIVRSTYSVEKIGERLAAMYAATREADGETTEIRGASIVEHFADPSRVHPLRFERVEDGESAHAIPLGEVIASLSDALAPQATNEKSVLPKLDGLRAVVFDVYGTLLISGSGDISLASEGSRGAAALEALQAVFGEPATQVAGVKRSLDESPTTRVVGSPVDGDAIVAALHDAIHAAHSASPSEHPEVEIRRIWRTVLDGFAVQATDDQIERLAVEYECRVNPIWPMPGLLETLEALGKSGVEMGIVSNAQFFTPLAFEPLSGKPLGGWGFPPELCVWSYEHGEAKPGTALYERCAEALAARGIAPGEALFVGNDLRNDVWPAQQVGFRTALFAGDARSLRWRRDDDRLRDVRPDAVVTDLRQLVEIVL